MNRIMTAGTLTLVITVLAACAGAATGSTPQADALKASAQTQDSAAQLNGTWQGSLTDPMGTKFAIELTLALSGSVVEGEFIGAPPPGKTEPLKSAIKSGKLEGSRLTFQIAFNMDGEESPPIFFKGTVNGNRIRGVQGSGNMPMDMAWEVTKR